MRVRGIGEWHFEDGGILSMKIIGPTPMYDVLVMAQTLLDLKRKEIDASPLVLNTPSTGGCADAKAGGSGGLTSISSSSDEVAAPPTSMEIEK